MSFEYDIPYKKCSDWMGTLSAIRNDKIYTYTCYQNDWERLKEEDDNLPGYSYGCRYAILRTLFTNENIMDKVLKECKITEEFTNSLLLKVTIDFICCKLELNLDCTIY
jgi:hypothetical protein